MTAEIVTVSKEIARPLSVLVPLIRQDLTDAQKAGMPYYQSAGEKMLEAKLQMQKGQFGPWLKRSFNIGNRQAQLYMSYARNQNGQKRITPPVATLREFIREHTSNKRFGNKSEWRAQIDAAFATRNVESMRQDQLAQDKERALQKKMALQIIEIGYKVLASKLHPDKGGTREAMARLNIVRNRMKDCV
jgi:hypothetical protein